MVPAPAVPDDQPVPLALLALVLLAVLLLDEGVTTTEMARSGDGTAKGRTGRWV